MGGNGRNLKCTWVDHSSVLDPKTGKYGTHSSNSERSVPVQRVVSQAPIQGRHFRSTSWTSTSWSNYTTSLTGCNSTWTHYSRLLLTTCRYLYNTNRKSRSFSTKIPVGHSWPGTYFRGIVYGRKRIIHAKAATRETEAERHNNRILASKCSENFFWSWRFGAPSRLSKGRGQRVSNDAGKTGSQDSKQKQCSTW